MITQEGFSKQHDLAIQALKDSHEVIVMKVIYSIPLEPLEFPDGTKMETFGCLQYDKPKCWEELNLDNETFGQLMKNIAKEAIKIAAGES